MKYTILLMGAVLLLYSCNPLAKEETARKDYTITLTAPGFEDSTLFIIYSSDLKKNLDSGYLVNETLTMTGSVEFPQYVKIHTPLEGSGLREYKRLLFWLDNKDIRIIGPYSNFENSQVFGSPLNDMHHQIDKELEALDAVRDSLLRTYRSMSDPNAYIVQTLDHYDSLRQDVILKYISEHPNNEVCIRKLALYKEDIPLEQLLNLFRKVDKEYYSYIHSEEIMAYIARSKDEQLYNELKDDINVTSVD